MYLSTLTLTIHECSLSECNKENSLRLRNGQDQFEGRVEICTRTSLRSRRLGWRAVCDNGWDIHEARVTCRQLGFEINGLGEIFTSIHVQKELEIKFDVQSICY